MKSFVGTFLLFLVLPVAAQIPVGRVIPPNPTTNDSIAVRIPVPCWEAYQPTVARSGNTITITMVDTGFCAPILADKTVTIGFLDPGNYIVNVVFPDSPQLNHSVSFAVTALVPALGATELMILAGALLLIAVVKLR